MWTFLFETWKKTWVIKDHPSIYDATVPCGPWPPSETPHSSLFLLVSSILVFQDLSCVSQDDVLPSYCWFSHLFRVMTFPIKNRFFFWIHSCTALIVRSRILVLQLWTVFGRSMYQKSNPFPYSLIVFCLSSLSEASLRCSEHQLFSRGWC